jgi:hypothetical protein
MHNPSLVSMQHPGLQKLVALQLVGVTLNGDLEFGSVELSQFVPSVFWHHALLFVFSQQTLYEGQLDVVSARARLNTVSINAKLTIPIIIFFVSFLFFTSFPPILFSG